MPEAIPLRWGGTTPRAMCGDRRVRQPDADAGGEHAGEQHVQRDAAVTLCISGRPAAEGSSRRRGTAPGGSVP